MPDMLARRAIDGTADEGHFKAASPSGHLSHGTVIVVAGSIVTVTVGGGVLIASASALANDAAAAAAGAPETEAIPAISGTACVGHAISIVFSAHFRQGTVMVCRSKGGAITIRVTASLRAAETAWDAALWAAAGPDLAKTVPIEAAAVAGQVIVVVFSAQIWQGTVIVTIVGPVASSSCLHVKQIGGSHLTEPEAIGLLDPGSLPGWFAAP